ncbi:MAG: hypothetical protein NTX48_07855 [Planctomycetales bacterium]|nr:hypothetical protein [Planctomycetales bacterium]
MFAILEKLRGRKREIVLTVAGEFQQLAIDCEAGKERDPDQILADLERLGKTEADLEKAMSLIVERRALEVTMNAGVGSRAALERIAGEIQATRKSLQDANSEFNAAMEKLRADEQTHMCLVTAADDARGKLLASSNAGQREEITAEIDSKIQALNQERTELPGEIERLYNWVRAIDGKITDAETRRGQPPSASDRDKLPGEQERLSVMKARYVCTLPELEKLQGERDAILRCMLRPEAI